MKGLFSALLFTCCFSSFAQQIDSFRTSWEKILITDAHLNWRKPYNHQYTILNTHQKLFLQNSSGVPLKEVNPMLIDHLFTSLQNKRAILKDPLVMFGKDSLWLINNAEKLWHDYLQNKDEPAEVDSIAIVSIKDYSKVKNSIWRLQGMHWTDNYPRVIVAIIKQKDTLSFASNGQYPYLLPWLYNGNAVYNSNLSTTIAQILPDSTNSNKNRLQGNHFNYYLVQEIYEAQISSKRDFIGARNTYPKQFQKLQKHFHIQEADLSDMGSIEWGGFMMAPCLTMSLTSPLLPDNIEFVPVFGRRIKLHPISPIIRKHKKVISRLANNPVFEYTKNNKGCDGVIHFVNRKSLSGQAKREFLRDIKENGGRKSLFRGKFHKAIFYELTESREKQSSFSRWIFLHDGTMILWQLEGDFLMNLPDAFTREKGYVCLVISREDIL